jgi:hypothetical protein
LVEKVCRNGEIKKTKRKGKMNKVAPAKYEPERCLPSRNLGTVSQKGRGTALLAKSLLPGCVYIGWFCYELSNTSFENSVNSKATTSRGERKMAGQKGQILYNRDLSGISFLIYKNFMHRSPAAHTLREETVIVLLPHCNKTYSGSPFHPFGWIGKV